MTLYYILFACYCMGFIFTIISMYRFYEYQCHVKYPIGGCLTMMVLIIAMNLCKTLALK